MRAEPPSEPQAEIATWTSFSPPGKQGKKGFSCTGDRVCIWGRGAMSLAARAQGAHMYPRS